MTPERVSIIIPALNESAVIGDVVRHLVKRFPEAELFVIDDGSCDQTAKAADEAGACVIRHERSYGYGAALRTGTLAATREYALFCDGDGQHAPEDVERILRACRNVDMVVGARTAHSYMPFCRAPGKRVLRWFADYLAGQSIPDVNSGLRIIKREVLLKYLHLMPQGFSFSTTSTFALLKSHYRIAWIPITVRKRVGKSTVRQWKDGPQTLLLMLRLTVLFEPLKVFLTVAALLCAFSLFSFILDILSASGQGLSDTTVILSIATLLVFMFGLLCDQVSALRRELHDR